jgi:replicative DNA helicase
MHQKIPNNELDVEDPIENGEENVKEDETVVMNEISEFDAMNVDDLVNCYEDDSEEEALALEKQVDPTVEEIMKFYESDSWKESMENLDKELNNCTAGLANGNIDVVKEKPSILKPRNSGIKTTTRKKPKRN